MSYHMISKCVLWENPFETSWLTRHGDAPVNSFAANVADRRLGHSTIHPAESPFVWTFCCTQNISSFESSDLGYFGKDIEKKSRKIKI